MKKIIALLITITLVLSFAGCGSKKDEPKEYANSLEKILGEGVITIATSPDFAPMEFTDSTKTDQEQYVGFDMSLAKYIAKELGVELKIEAMEFSACQAAVSGKSVDMSLSGYSWLEERAQNFNLSDTYYAGENSNLQSILVLKDRAAELNTKEAFAGKTLSAQNASLQWNLLTSQLPDSTANPITDLNVAVLEVINAKVDGLCVEQGNGEAFVANYPELALSDFHFEIEDDGYVVLMPKGEDALTAKVNEILAKALSENVYGTWYTEAVELAKTLGVN